MENGVRQALGNLEAKVDILLARSDDTEDRLRELEKTKNWSKGVAAAVLCAWAAILKLLLWR